MSDKQPNALRLADKCLDCAPCREDVIDAAAELRRLHALCDEMGKALGFYGDETRYHGPNQRLDLPDGWSEKVGLESYRLDVTRDGGVIARTALAKWKESK